MRRGNKNGLLLTAGGALMGINLGADYCSEHEWGIKGLRALFGIPETGYGLAKRTITKMPTTRDYFTKTTKPCVHLVETKTETFLIVSEYFEADKFDAKKDPSRYELARYKDDGMRTAWDEKSFGISAMKPDEREALRTIHAAMQTNDLAIWLGGGGVFENAGLVLAIASRIPYEKSQMLYDADVDYEKLQKTAEATGIAKRLEAAGKRYYALSPRWAKDRSEKTKYEVVFWLNPCEQQRYNYGSFTVEQLDQWAKDQGPIMMEKSASK